jgi:hypothetical protein
VARSGLVKLTDDGTGIWNDTDYFLNVYDEDDNSLLGRLEPGGTLAILGAFAVNKLDSKGWGFWKELVAYVKILS